jgi:Arc/MetJ-type ribon-helix-helix transcriptional regulator
MAITLDPATEQRIQRELDRGHYGSPAEVIEHALNLLQAEEDWLADNSRAIHDHIEESFAAADRGETYTPEQARALLAKSRAGR